VEVVEVAGAADVPVEIVETGRGPVIAGGPDGDGAALSLRYPPRVRAELGFAALPALLRARTVADVDRAFDHWVEPVNVLLAADTAGGLLHRVAGAVPVRDAANLLRPVPGWEAGHDWRGWHPLPRRDVDGVAVMANERGLAEPLGLDFAAPYRADRIRELLLASTGWRADDMAAVHTDTLLPSAGRLLGLLADADGLSPAAARLCTRLLGWDRRMAADSTDATAYAAFRGAVLRALTGHPALAVLAEPGDHPAEFARWLELPTRAAYALDTLLATDLLPDVDRPALVAAAAERAATVEPAPWGEVHRLAPWQAHPLTPDEEWPGLPGDHDCVLSTSSVPGVTERFARGPAARYVWDLANRDDSRWVVPLGAAGQPDHPHGRDQAPLWARGELVPVVTDWTLLTREDDD
jgi:penicillin amidase